METSELLRLFGEKEPREVYELIDPMFKGVKTKCSFLVNVYCSHFIDRNIWALRAVHGIVQTIECEKSSKKAAEMTLYLISLLKSMRLHSYTAFSGDVTKSDIEDVLYLYDRRVGPGASEAYRELFLPEAYDAFSTLECLIKDKRVSDAVHVFSFLLCCKQAQLFSKTGCDIAWIVMDMIMTLPMSNEARDFIGCARDLYFFKLKEKQRAQRRPALYIAVLVAAVGDPKNRPLKGILKDDRMSYLYVLTEVDSEVNEEVEKDRRRRSRSTRGCKTFQVDSKDYDRLERTRHSMSIIKSN